MKIIRDLAELSDISGSVVTDGMFDGMHAGHISILKRVVDEAKKANLPSIILTYWPHPRHILPHKGQPLRLLSTLEEKAEQAEMLGIDYVVVLNFTTLFSQISHEQFVKDILVDGLKTRKLIIGYDHRFGKNRMGDIGYLKEVGPTFGFTISEIGQQEVEEIAISSTKIRYALQHHKIETAATFLGRNYSITGTVVDGDKRGRNIGFPTANLSLIEPSKLIPADGVYATWAWLGKKRYASMTNIGFRPTVDGKKHTVETHILNFDQDIYGKNLTIEFVELLRMEQRFNNVDELKNQLEKDRLATKAILDS